MNELLQYLLSLLIHDTEILTLFENNGQPNDPNIVISSDQSEIRYPWVFIRNTSMKQLETSDLLPLVYNGEVLLEIRVKRSDNCKQPEALRWSLFNRIMALLFGDMQSTSPVVKTHLAHWTVTGFCNADPTGDISDPDPLLKRHKITARVQLLRRV